ncbi:6-phosphofructo-2-kinase/fructose-2,6-bisphosphatase 1-like [Sycon ciliatum]|uniref:6-phosphofructo-2-kinase/fructose-2, 6-bisphosphatase 1-like n=1 Tax=Sycon ciliatum TaxID=27933 RepID=UPI0020A9F748|eukprot:scpid21913/ scgid13690/ 6-phosphofructo-2-kinase/fructose-2,6-bisphosphatase 1; 6PF-2-K/Fru-2,6-P2ase liver isozyme; 6-phosphofructo-2-kinase; Fructose-2,6-bisphosphatase
MDTEVESKPNGIVRSPSTMSGCFRRNAFFNASQPPLVNVPTCIVMVGLPARGKTYIAKKLARYLNWIGVSTKVFNVGEYRRRVVGSAPVEFFDPSNEDAVRIRRQCCIDALQDVGTWLMEDDGQAAVLDATNTTRERRKMIVDCLGAKGIRVFFVESVCNDSQLVERNVRAVKLKNPDFIDQDMDKALAEFKTRLELYEKVYEPLDFDDDTDLSFVTLYDVGSKLMANKIRGHLQSRIIYFLMNVHIKPRNIFLTRHGESDMNKCGRIGGDGVLTENGIQYGIELASFIDRQKDVMPNLRVWTSQLRRTIQTAEKIDAPREPWTALNELDAGDCDGLTYEQIQETFPSQFALRDQDKFHYRYPRGESYEDLVARLEPVIMELERQGDVLVVCHQAVSRCLLAYFLDKSYDELPYLKVPLHTVIKLTPLAYGCLMEEIPLCPDMPVVNTHRSKPPVVDVERSVEDALETVPSHM